jgi:glutathione synthase/RimK-type ligase-like ATP-grasp enzyme
MKTKVITNFRPVILSRHPSHNVLRGALPRFKTRVVIRLGSTTQLNDGKKRIEINKIEAINNSASKLRMKRCFTDSNINTAEWIEGKSGSQAVTAWCRDRYPIIAKGIFGSRGQANTKIDTPQVLQTWLNNRDLDRYIFEKFFDGSREYRFHVSTEGVFLTWRKLRRNDTPDNQRWFFNNQNCNWVSEQHELYNKPTTYKQIGDECLKALNAVGLEIGGCDVRVNKKGEFKIIEINSACSFAEVTAEAYKTELIKLITNKTK